MRGGSKGFRRRARAACTRRRALRPWARPEEAAQDKFLAALEREKVAATLRREKGGDIDAACGQLRRKNMSAISA